MRVFAYRFRRLAAWERANRRCRMVTQGDDGQLLRCWRLAGIEFEGVRAALPGREKSGRLDYCETHGKHVAGFYGVRIMACDEAA